MFFFKDWNSVWYKLLRLFKSPATAPRRKAWKGIIVAGSRKKAIRYSCRIAAQQNDICRYFLFDSIPHSGILLSSNKTFVRLTDTLTKP
jgi:hypothetical protein